MRFLPVKKFGDRHVDENGLRNAGMDSNRVPLLKEGEVFTFQSYKFSSMKTAIQIAFINLNRNSDDI